MKNADEVIERVLAGLREAEAAPGIERRALEAARSRQMARPPRRRTLMPVLCGVAFAALIVTALAVRMNHRRAPEPALTNRAPLNSMHSAAPEPLVSSAHIPAGWTASQRMQHTDSRPRLTSTRLVAVDDPDALAVREMRAPSRPAPPMPLTAQEKVLREIARAPDPQQIAMLDPVLREKQEAEVNADFQRFLNSQYNRKNAQQKGEVTNEMESQ